MGKANNTPSPDRIVIRPRLGTGIETTMNHIDNEMMIRRKLFWIGLPFLGRQVPYSNVKRIYHASERARWSTFLEEFPLTGVLLERALVNKGYRYHIFVTSRDRGSMKIGTVYSSAVAQEVTQEADRGIGASLDPKQPTATGEYSKGALRCRYHPEEVAEHECSGCHKSYCLKCVEEVGGQHYCEVCYSRLIRKANPDTGASVDVNKIKTASFWGRLAVPLYFIWGLPFALWYGVIRSKRAAQYQDISEKKIAEGRLKDGSLLKDLRGRDATLRQTAADTLGEIGGEKEVEPLIEALKDRGTYVRSSAARALGKISDARATEPLISALGDESAFVRGEAASALGRIGGEKAINALRGAQDDENAMVRKAVEEALERIEARKESDG